MIPEPVDPVGHTVLTFYNVLPMSSHTRYLCPRSIHPLRFEPRLTGIVAWIAEATLPTMIVFGKVAQFEPIRRGYTPLTTGNGVISNSSPLAFGQFPKLDMAALAELGTGGTRCDHRWW